MRLPRWTGVATAARARSGRARKSDSRRSACAPPRPALRGRGAMRSRAVSSHRARCRRAPGAGRSSRPARRGVRRCPPPATRAAGGRAWRGPALEPEARVERRGEVGFEPGVEEPPEAASTSAIASAKAAVTRSLIGSPLTFRPSATGTRRREPSPASGGRTARRSFAGGAGRRRRPRSSGSRRRSPRRARAGVGARGLRRAGA